MHPKATGLADAIATTGWGWVDTFLVDAELEPLVHSARALQSTSRFRPAGIGRGARRQIVPGLRGDSICWLDADRQGGAIATVFARMDALRLLLNERLYLGLFDYEAHFAIYPPGARYARHLDQHRGESARVLSAVLYLNTGWQPDDGGALRLYVDADRRVDLAPEGGRLVVFLSERFEHEVLPAARERLALTGWFRHRG